MQELTFETILRLPQMELKKRLKAELKSRGYPVTDKPGYLYAEGTIPVLLVAHMDTVHRQPVEQICYSADRAVAMSPQGIGGDDRCGVWMILQILRTANCHVLFCEDEEVGCVGAKKFTRGPLRPQVNYIVELDRRGSNDAVFYRCDNPEFEDFVTSFGFETAGGSCSDISYIAPYLETAAVNISCGYYCEHQRHECIHLAEMELNADRVAQMVTQQTEHFEYMEQQDSFFGGRVYQYSMWGMASERETYKWLSPLPKEAKIKLGTAELIMSHAKIDRQGKVHRYVPKLKAAVLTENAIAVMPDGKKAAASPSSASTSRTMASTSTAALPAVVSTPTSTRPAMWSPASLSTTPTPTSTTRACWSACSSPCSRNITRASLSTTTICVPARCWKTPSCWARWSNAAAPIAPICSSRNPPAMSSAAASPTPTSGPRLLTASGLRNIPIVPAVHPAPPVLPSKTA